MNTYHRRKFEEQYALFIRLLILQGFSKATIDNYTRAIRRLAEWFDVCPGQRLTKSGVFQGSCRLKLKLKLCRLFV